MEGLVALLIPIVSVLGTVFILAYVVKIRHDTRSDMQKTIRMALEKGQELSPEVIEQMTGPKKGKSHNLKVGLIWIAVALGFAVLGLGVPDAEATRVMAGVSAMPLFIGFAYLIMWRFAGQD